MNSETSSSERPSFVFVFGVVVFLTRLFSSESFLLLVDGYGGLGLLAGLGLRLVLVHLPHLVHQVGDHQVRGVLGDDPHDEHAVVPQVLLGELGAQLLVEARVKLVVDLQVLLDVGRAVALEDDAVQPGGQVDAGEEGDQHQPEPDEDEDLLVEEVDGQHALHGPRLDVLQLADAEVAERDAGEARRLLPGVRLAQLGQHLEAVHVVVRGQEGVQDEELGDHVGSVQHLHSTHT